MSARTDNSNFIYIWRRVNWDNPPFAKFYNGDTYISSVESDALGRNSEIEEETLIFRVAVPEGATNVGFAKTSDGGSTGNVKPEIELGSVYRIGQGGGVTAYDDVMLFTKHNATIETPAYKTDFDYIYFTDTDDWKNTSDTNRIYAYYYGGVDGEYMAWPGVPAEGSYVDDNGKTVYRFQPPSQTVGEGDSATTVYPYPYVIFNNGSSSTNPVRSITQKIEYKLGYNYTPNGAETAYGTVTAHAKAADSGTDKAHSETADAEKLAYNKYSPDKYIYIVNNGTQNTSDLSNTDRFTLDEMHVTFFDGDKNAIGTASPGYYADRIEYSNYNNSDVYKISVPEGAKYFRVSNGQGKNGSSQEHLRQSVIEPLSINGLYQFVVDSDISKIWNTGETVGSGLNEHPYYLTLLNKREEEEEDDEPIITGSGDPEYIATVETDDDGLIKWITRLREKPAEGQTYNKDDKTTYQSGTVDTNYLAHVPGDIRKNGVHTVKVVKWGTYFWKEIQPPVGYQADKQDWDDFQINAQEADKAVNVFTATDTHKHGTVQLTKTAEQALGDKAVGTPLADASFRLYSKEHPEKPIFLLKKTDASVYYVAEEKTSKSSIKYDSSNENHPYFEVTDTAMQTDLAGYNPYTGIEGSFELYDTVTTGADGKLLIENLDWGEYSLKEVTAPVGYSLTDTTTGQSNEVNFSVGRNTCELTQKLTCTDEIAPAKLKIQKIIDRYIPAWGTPTFIFKIKKLSTDESPTTYERLVSLQVTHTDTLTDATGWIDIEPGQYEVSELNVSRYALDKCEIGDNNTNENTYVTNQTVSFDKKATFTVKANGEVTVTFENVVEYYDKFSHNDLAVNNFHGSKSLKVENKAVPVVDSSGKVLERAEINKTDLIVHLIGADGKPTALNDIQKKELTFEAADITFVPDSLTAKVLGSDNTPVVEITSSDGSFTIDADQAVEANNKGYYFILLKDLPEDNHYVIEKFTGAKNVTLKEKTASDGKKDILVTAEKAGENDPFKFCVSQKQYDARFADALLFDAEGETIIVKNPSLFADGVYRLKAAYGGLSGTFDLIFGSRNQKPKQYEKTFVFHADVDNLSYFDDGGVHTSQYGFTFSMVLKDNPDEGYEVYSIRHNGQEVTIDEVQKIISNTDNTLKIIEARPNYTFSGTWNYNGAEYSALQSSDIETIAKLNNGDKIVEYTAKLVRNP